MMAIDKKETVMLFDPKTGLDDGSFWLKSQDERAQIKRDLTSCMKTLSPECAKAVKQKSAEIEAHEKVTLHPRDRVVFICNTNGMKMGTHGTLVFGKSDDSGVYVLPDGSENEVWINRFYLDPESPNPGPMDIYELTEYENAKVDVYVHEFLKDTSSKWNELGKLKGYGLVEPFFYRLLMDNPIIAEQIVKQECVQSYFRDFFSAYVDASMRVITELK
jgi:hypothetical protein